MQILIPHLRDGVFFGGEAWSGMEYQPGQVRRVLKDAQKEGRVECIGLGRWRGLGKEGNNDEPAPPWTTNDGP